MHGIRTTRPGQCRHATFTIRNGNLMILLQHLRAKTPLGSAFTILIRTYQLWAGISEPVLTNTRPCEWVPDCWLSRVCRTLHKHNIQIQDDYWTVPSIRQFDVHLLPTIPMNQLFDGSPVIPSDQYSRRIQFPIITPDQPLPPSTPIKSFKSLTQQFCSTMPLWQKPLFGPIYRLQPTNRLYQLSATTQPIVIVSDTLLQKDLHSRFAWVITTMPLLFGAE